MANGNVDVVVVGGGPTGLLTAGELRRRGVAVRLVEKHAQRQELSKALVVQARTLEQMDLLGLAEHFLSRGYPAPGLNMSLDNRRSVSIEMHVLQTRFPYLLVLPQQETENILEDHLRSCGGSLDRGVEARGVEQDGREVKVRLQGPDNSEAIVPCSYLVACDGAHSTIRENLSVEFRGREQDYVVFLADVKLSSEFNKARITNFTSARGFLSVLPFLGDYARIFTVDYTKQDRSPDDELTLEDLQETVDAIAPFPLKLTEPRWITRFLSPSRQVPNTRCGRVFFVGDAAHAHSPAGGQGMNNGLQDAFNLSWKLAMVVRGEAPESLLDTYDLERRPVDAAAQRKTDLMFASFTLRNPLLKPVRDFILHSLVPRKRVQARLAGDLSGISVTYRSTSLSRSERRRGRNAIGPGDRVPDVELWREGQSEARLYELLRAPNYLLIAYGTNEAQHRWRDRLSQWLGEVASRCGHALHSVVILDEGFLSEPGGSTPVFVDYKRQFRRAFSPPNEAIVLIRPDGYVAVQQRGFDAGGLNVFASWIRARPGQEASHDLHSRRELSGE